MGKRKAVSRKASGQPKPAIPNAGKSVKNSSTSPEAIERAQLIATALQHRINGKSFPKIAKEMQIAQSTAYELVVEGMKSMVREPAKELIELEVARLDAMLENLQAAIEKGCTKSVNSALKISERRAALLGLDINAANDSADKKTGKEFDSDFLSLMGRIANSLEQ